VAVSGFEAIKEVQANPDFINRMDDRWLLDKTQGIPCGMNNSFYFFSYSLKHEMVYSIFLWIPGLFFGQGDYWAKTRRATHSLLKEFGFGSPSSMEPLIIKELTVSFSELQSQLNNGVGVIEIKHQFEVVNMNVIWGLITGSRFEHDDPKLHHLLTLNRGYEISTQIGGGIAALFPKLLYIAPKLTGYTKHMELSNALRTFMEVNPAAAVYELMCDCD